MSHSEPLADTVAQFASSGNVTAALTTIGIAPNESVARELRFRLASGLAESGHRSEAITISVALFQEFPGFLENVVLLVNLLHSAGLTNELKHVLATLGETAKGNPEFYPFVVALQYAVLDAAFSISGPAVAEVALKRLYSVLQAVLAHKTVRIDVLNYDTIGGLAVDARWMPKFKASGLIDDVVFLCGKAANAQLAKMLARCVPLIQDESIIERPCQVFDWTTQMSSLDTDRFKERFWGRKFKDSFDGSISFFMSTNGRTYVSTDRLADIARNPARITFTPEEESEGERYQRYVMGVGTSASMVGLQIRDAAFYQETEASGKAFRNVDAERSVTAIHELTSRGHYVLRFGAKVARPLNIADSRYVDYATRFRTEFMDIYLFSKIRYLVGVPSGLSHLADLFNKPILHINSVNMYAYGAALYIPKKMRCAASGNPLSFKESIDRLYSYSGYMDLWEDGPGQREKLGIVYEENTSEEIQEAVIEMDARMSGTYVESAEGSEIQKNFAELWRPYSSSLHSSSSSIATSYLLRNKHLL